MRRVRYSRDPASVDELRKLWWQASKSPRPNRYGMTDTHKYLSNLEPALVLADGLEEYGYLKLAQDLRKTARQYSNYWEMSARYGWSITKPRENQISKRVTQALREIQTKVNVWLGTKKSFATIRYYGKISSSPVDVEGPFPAKPSDFIDLESIRKWWFKTRKRPMSRISQWRKERGKIVLFPSSMGSTHSIVIEPGRKKLDTDARIILEIADELRQKKYKEPLRYARIIFFKHAGAPYLKQDTHNKLQINPNYFVIDSRFNFRRNE